MKCICIFCGNIQNEEFKEKTTMLCKKCSRPTDCYEDGRFEISPLYYAEGNIWAKRKDDHNVGTGFGWKGDDVLTLSKEEILAMTKEKLDALTEEQYFAYIVALADLAEHEGVCKFLAGKTREEIREFLKASLISSV